MNQFRSTYTQTIILILLMVVFGMLEALPQSHSSRSPGAQGPAARTDAAALACGPLGSPRTRTTLYFGLSRRGGSVSEKQWRNFLRDEVTRRFPDGLTVWEADGQWRKAEGHIGRERAKVVLMVHDDTPQVKAAIEAIIWRYKGLFEQESVLWETTPVCAAF